jgi:excisionase family DNA binding protein
MHAGLADYRRRVAGQDPEVDAALLRMVLDARRYRLGAVPSSVHPDPRHAQSDDHHLVSTAQAAETLGCDISTVGRWVRRGRLPAELIGNRWVIKVDDLARVAEARATGTTQDAPSRDLQPRPVGEPRAG